MSLTGSAYGMGHPYVRAWVQASRGQFDEYARRTAGSGGAASEIEKAKRLLDSGTISQAEFDAIKAKALGSSAGSGSEQQPGSAAG